MAQINIASITHPYCDKMSLKWAKWRTLMEDTDGFIRSYLQKFSAREDNYDYTLRLSITPCPAYAKSTLIEFRNAIIQAFPQIRRIGGSSTYQSALRGQNGGVDGKGGSIDHLIGYSVLHELLSMARVGIFVDRPNKPIVTKADARNSQPYIYIYKAEQIKSWAIDGQGRLTRVLLEDETECTDPNTDLPTGTEKRYRLLTLIPEGGVSMVIMDRDGNEVENIVLALPEIPFYIASISESLLDVTTQYQIALMNMESSDIMYVLKANFPFYTEQYAPQARHYGAESTESDATAAATATTEEKRETGVGGIKVGATQGRLYAKGMDRPGFIHPSSEPLDASMRKQEVMKQTIRHLMQLTIASLKPIRESAESKDRDQAGLKAGLAYIGIELQAAEQAIARLWANYERQAPATIYYPEEYDTRSLDQRIDEANNLRKLGILPSPTYQRELAIQIAQTLFGHRVSVDVMDKIEQEIKAAPAVAFDPEIVNSDIESGFLDRQTAAELRGYPDGTADTAIQEHIERLAAVALAQTPIPDGSDGPADRIRGVTDDKTTIQDDRTDPTAPTGKKKLRGGGRGIGRDHANRGSQE